MAVIQLLLETESITFLPTRQISEITLPALCPEKEIAPSKELRNWFKHIPERYDEFAVNYVKELEGSDEAGDFLNEVETLLKTGDVTLLYSSKDQKHNNAVVLKKWLEKRMDQFNAI